MWTHNKNVEILFFILVLFFRGDEGIRIAGENYKKVFIIESI